MGSALGDEPPRDADPGHTQVTSTRSKGRSVQASWDRLLAPPETSEMKGLYSALRALR